MNIEIRKSLLKILINSLNSGQINYLGESINGRFNLYRESGFRETMPIPQQTAAQTLLNFFNTDEDMIQIFTYLLRHEDERFHTRTLKVWGKVQFIKLLEKHKWIFDEDLVQFFLDPFFENEINFLKSLRIIDLRDEVPIQDIMNGITEVSQKMSIHDLEWRITLRLYDLDSKISSLIRKIIELLLVRQNLKPMSFEVFTCLKELVINASKANYKLLYEKYMTTPNNLTTHSNYAEFLANFKGEIEEHGNERLLELAKKDDSFINIIFQSTNESIDIWVTNSKTMSAIEKQELLKKLGKGSLLKENNENDYTEGAGLGINLVLNILKKYSNEQNTLKIVFYPHFVKIGFSLERDEIAQVIKEKTAAT